MTEKNEIYLSPEIQVVELENESILCASQFPSSQNEGYEDGIIDGWF